MHRTQSVGSYHVKFHPYLSGRTRPRKREMSSEQDRNVLQEIGSVAAVLHRAGLLTDFEVMRQFQEFAVNVLNSCTEDLKELMPASLLTVPAAAMTA